MTVIPATILSDPALIAVLDMIEQGGHRAYLVGGAVRNALLGVTVDDIDIATDAHPEEVVALARAARLKPVPTGIDHGTVTVVSEGIGFEVTTFRRDVETDGRHATVAFSGELAEDAARRDFTMNALYADRTGRVIDPVGGIPDLHAGRLRFVGDPKARIVEDYLRILRFFRFLAWYGREAQPEAIAACAELRPGLDRIAKERIGAEMRKLLSAPNPAPAIALMAQTGVLVQILPGADPSHLAALIAAEEDAPPNWSRRLAALGADDPAGMLRLSRGEAKAQAVLSDAIAAKPGLDAAGYHLGLETATDLALIHIAQGEALPEGWRERLADAASSPLPISARDLSPPLTGKAIGRGLQAAEALWIASGFKTPAPALIDAALLAGEEE
ncbi:CCA tRNA nucleotidyltransferase [Paracoccus caeni]|uniref:CCA tRNA nucleotidyltransferase n=1 Tax=Paracoccus caeni TaxID=657651 RepID=A0A934SDL2_9RHOB|nr:CCA tRNA nucleotidyltransferase [Paracoccus caeni]MBK4216936.1 CCA tRNA nucleotidyltransferase [Paracoccus caeni]